MVFPDRLKLFNETIVGDELLEKTKKEIISRAGDFVPTITFEGRDLQAAGLSGADLRGVSLFGTAMQGSDLSSARLDGALMTLADLRAALLNNAQLPGANLTLDPDGARHRRRLATILGDLACAPHGAPYVARGLVETSDSDFPRGLARLGEQFDAVRERLKAGREKPETCKGVVGFTEEDWRKLDAIKLN